MEILIATLRDILLIIGLELIKTAPTVIAQKVVDSNTQPNEPNDSNLTELVDAQELMFDRDNVFRTMLEQLINDIVKLRSNIDNTRAGIVYALSGSRRPASLVDLLIEHVDSRNITVVTNSNNIKEVLYGTDAVKEICEYARLTFESYFFNVDSSIDEQSRNANLPELVGSFISEVFRSRGIRPYNYAVQLYDSSSHLVYSEANQKDIFGNELVYGRLAIIKYKDRTANVFTYAIAQPQVSSWDESLNGEYLDFNSILGTASQILNLDNTKLVVKQIPFNKIKEIVKIIYK